MAKYKHKKTGKVFTDNGSANNSFRLENSKYSYLVPRDVVIESNDWEFIKEVLFKTEEGTEKIQGDSCYYVNTAFEVKFWKTIYNFGNAAGYKYFDSKDAAEAYAEAFKPKYSLHDFTKAIAEVGFPFYISEAIVERLIK